MRRAAATGSVLLVAVLATLLNAPKPLHIDDTANYYYARQAAARPLDPYGFDIFWYDRPEHANEVLNPLGLPYWWSLALRVSDEPVLWKLWLLPFVLCLTWSLYALFRRFTPLTLPSPPSGGEGRVRGGLALPLTWLTMLSPAFLPAINLMPDVPAHALALASVCLFLDGADRRSLPRVVLAGLVAGVAMQTKYTALLAPGVMFLYALTHGRLRLWPAAAAAALAVFAGWEVFVARTYGQSHFLYHLTHGRRSLLQRADGLPLLLSVSGSVAPAVLVLALAALRVRRVLVLSAAGLTLLGYAVVACVGVRFLGEGTLFPLLPGAGKVVWDFTLEDVLFGVYGLALWGAVGVAAWRLCRRPNGRPRPDDWFLALWLGLEAGGFLALSPFPAVRRVMGTVVVLTLLAGRLASRTCRHGPRRQLVRVAVALGVLLGLLFWAVDFRAANAQRQAVRRAADCIAPEMNGRETVWYTGHWGFQFYAERAGMRPVVLGEPLRRDDWLVVPDEQIDQQEMRRDGEPLRLVREVVIDDRQPLQTVPFYYIGNVGLGHRRLPYLRVRVYRVTAGFVPRSGP